MGGGNSKQVETTAIKTPSEAVSLEVTPPTPEAPAASDESKCPMHNSDGSYSYDWRQFFKAAAVHGPQGQKPLSEEQKEAAMQTPAAEEGGCPVKHSPKVEAQLPDQCPVKGESSYPEYNVYSQPIDKTNQMPKGVKTQLPSPTQTAELSTSRVSSTIPKGGGDDAQAATWTYPSPQQFYNALSRKGKLGDTTEDDIDTVVALHNNMNEKTWAQVVEWEHQTYKSETRPKLLKFQGRPHDLSPKAHLKHYLLGHPLPYDRHDWTILRDDGSTVRYIIDYYYDDTRAQETEASAKPALHDRQATPSLLVDVRPALDGPKQFLARAVQMPYKLWGNQTTFTPLPLRGTPEMADQVKESVKVWQNIQQLRDEELQAAKAEEESTANMKISETDAKDIAVNFAKALGSCRSQQAKVDSCQSEEECGKASVDLTMCLGPNLCQIQHSTLMKVLGEDDDARIEASLESLTECVVLQTAQRALAKKQHPTLFED